MEALVPAKTQAATISLRAAFLDGYGMYKPRAPRLARPLPIDALEAVMVWDSADTAMEEYTDDDEPSGIEAPMWREYAIKVRKFRKRRAVPLDHINYGKLGAAVQAVKAFGIAAAEFPDYELAKLLNNGTSATLGKCWNGGAFFRANHPLAPGKSSTTFGNLKTNRPLSQANWKLTRADLMKMKREDETFLGLEGDLLIVDPSNADLAREIVNATIISNTTNVLQGASEILVLPQLEEGVWYVGSAAEQHRPLVMAELEAARLMPTLGPGSEYTQMHDKVLYEARAKVAFGYSLPQFIIRNNPT